MVRAGIWGVGKAIPEKVLTNADLEKMVDTSHEWIIERTGIVERRIASPEQSSSDLASAAALDALRAAEVDVGELDMIIVATATPDMVFPATACLVQAEIGAKNAAAFDLLAGCTGFIYALDLAVRAVETGAYKRVLVIGADVLSKITNWRDRTTCVLFGDGAGACVVAPVKRGGVISTYLGADGSGGDKLSVPAGGSRLPLSAEVLEQGLHYIHMVGKEVFKFAVRIMGEASLEALQRAGLQPEDVDLLIPHQANIRIIDAAAKRLDLSPEKVFVNVDRYGNTGAASIPIAVHEALAQGGLLPGKRVVLVGFGAGLTYGACVLEWNSREDRLL
ncbi:MAG TPA: ketoacyl-ACP synthase III [Firmicutes bacterium]|nr:ketoacyl-ACP synthase III [Bacillota bacterium]